MSINQEETILEEEKKVFEEERKILKEEKGFFAKLQKREIIEAALFILILGGIAGGVAYWKITSATIYTDQAEISAPLIQLGPDQSGVLKQLFVQEGQTVGVNTPIARVGDNLIYTNTSGLIVQVNNMIGALFNPGMPVATMINPNDLRVVAQVEEDKGLQSVHVGQKVMFTVDAFGGKQFEGVVDEIAKTSTDSSVAFSISDKRPEKNFTVKITYDVQNNPELLNGMSAKVWIYK